MIGILDLEGLHTGEALAVLVNKRVEKYNIQDRIITITTDNVSDNGTLVGHINRFVKITRDTFEGRLFLDSKVT